LSADDESPVDPRDEAGEEPGDREPVKPKPQSTIAATGTRQAFRDIRRQLQEADLASPGVQKLLLDDLERAEAHNNILEGYIERYHQADKRAAVLEERLKSEKTIEIMFGVGISVGSALVGAAPSFWEQPHYAGPVVLSLGGLLIVGSIFARIVGR
jgi:hypothetical protein